VKSAPASGRTLRVCLTPFGLALRHASPSLLEGIKHDGKLELNFVSPELV
jgi:hypothetical protein